MDEYQLMSCMDHNIDLGEGMSSYVYRGTAESIFMGMVGWIALQSYKYAQPQFQRVADLNAEYDKYCKGVNPFRWFFFTNDKCRDINKTREDIVYEINKWLAGVFAALFWKALDILRSVWRSDQKTEKLKDEVWSLWTIRERYVCRIAWYIRSYYEKQVCSFIPPMGPMEPDMPSLKF